MTEASRQPGVRVEVLLLRLAAGGDVAVRQVSEQVLTRAPDEVAHDLAGEVRLVHSTSWRYDEGAAGADGAVVLTYAALPDPQPHLQAVPLHDPAVVCSGDALVPSPPILHLHHVAAHAVRHLAYLLEHDAGVRAAAELPADRDLWAAVRHLARHMPTGTHEQAHALAALRSAVTG